MNGSAKKITTVSGSTEFNDGNIFIEGGRISFYLYKPNGDHYAVRFGVESKEVIVDRWINGGSTERNTIVSG